MLNITEPEKIEKGFFAQPIFNLAFRSFFLLAALFSSLGLAIWTLNLNGIALLSQTGLSALVWHTHEMIFAFAATVAVGFVLTAVQTWTGVSSVKGKAMALLVALWLLIRALIWLNTESSIIMAAVVSAIWWSLVVFKFSQIVFKANNQRNYLFIPIFAVLGALNLAILIADLNGYPALAMHLAKIAVVMFCLIMTLVGGRVIPFFTVRGAGTPPAESYSLVEKIIMPLSAISAALYAVSYIFPMPMITAGAFALLGCLQFVRLSGWHGTKTAKVPLLWSLHLSYAAMALGLLLMGISYFVTAITFSSAIHIITIGAMGLMILAMMSRVSLGHTGRKLEIKPIITFSFLLLSAAAIVRILLPSLGMHLAGWSFSALMWICAFACFLWVYTPILFKPRVDIKFGLKKD